MEQTESERIVTNPSLDADILDNAKQIQNLDKSLELILNSELKDNLNASELNTTNKLELSVSDSDSDTFEPIVKSKKIGKLVDSDSDADNNIANANCTQNRNSNDKITENGQSSPENEENQLRQTILKKVQSNLIDSDSESENEDSPYNLMKLSNSDKLLSEESTDKESEVDNETIKLVRRKTKLKKTKPRNTDVRPDSDKDEVEKVI